jgi:medium-chain acyl-[acyl-carrier-protein] hydrolase
MSGAGSLARSRTTFSADTRWIRRAARPSPVLRLICLPFAGGGASVFYPLADLLPDSIELVAVQLPGREDRSRENLPTDHDALARRCAIALRPYCTAPFALYGHCAGALLAYEVARYMGEHFGRWPRRLVAAAQPAPHLGVAGTLLHRLSDAELLDVVRSRGGLPEAIMRNSAFVDFLLPVLRSDFTLWERYEHPPGPPLPCPVTTVRGRDDPLVTAESTSAWQEWTSVGVTEVVVDGGHYFINGISEGAARSLAGALLGN